MSHEGGPSAAAPGRPGGSGQVSPGAALRPGRSDAVILLVLWAARRSFWPLLLIGVCVMLAYGPVDEESMAALATPADLLTALLSPLALVAVAVIMRMAVQWLALLAAWPLSRWAHDRARRTGWRRYHDWVDRWRLVQAYRALRWTWGVRDEAVARAGLVGRRLALAVPISTAATILAAVALVLVVALADSGGQAAPAAQARTCAGGPHGPSASACRDWLCT